jgi:hypothetical protein
MILSIIIGFLSGFLCLIPGIGLPGVVLISAFGGELAVQISIFVSLAINTAVEATHPTASGNYESIVMTPMNVSVVLKNKIITLVIGVICGFMFFPFMTLRTPSLFIVTLIAMGILWGSCKSKEEWVDALIFIFLGGYILIVSSDVFTVGACLFTIPMLLREGGSNKEVEEHNKFTTINPVQMILSGIFSIFLPGISPGALSLSMCSVTKNGKFTASMASTFVEGMGLVFMLLGKPTGKSLLGSLSSQISMPAAILCLAMFGVCCTLVPSIALAMKKINPSVYSMIALAITLGLLTMINGLVVTIMVVPCAAVLILRSRVVSPEVTGLAFLSALFI